MRLPPPFVCRQIYENIRSDIDKNILSEGVKDVFIWSWMILYENARVREASGHYREEVRYEPKLS